MKKAVAVLSVLVVALSVMLGVSVFSSEEITMTAEDLDQVELRIDSYVDPGHLISTAAARNLMATDTDIVILDIRKAADYALGHIPGAQNIFRGDYSASEDTYGFGGMRASREDFEVLLGNLGVSDDTMILAYDAKGDYDAARFWWQLDMNGFRNIKLIDGGIVAWEAAGFEVSTQVPEVVPTNFTFSVEANTDRIATVEMVIDAINDPNVVILDTRSLEEMTGESLKNGASRPGRIPTAVWLEYKASLDEYKSFLDVDTLRAQFAEIGVTPDKTIIAYCQSGVRSAHTTFVLSQLLGFENVLNYDGSWIEWSMREDLAVETGMPEDVAARISLR